MQKRNKRRTKRARKLVVVCFLTAIVLTVSTYAWFIGMQTVNVSSFDVEIASTDSLLLSLDGKKWSTDLTISKETLNTVSYVGHKNSWGGTGLIPLSSIGELDSSVSRMKLFEKASLTTTPGGYRLMASRVNNYGEGQDEQSGYVVFDLFVKNFSGTQYIQELNEKDEEAIYLTIDSQVNVASGGVANTGIENSVRVAFAQIGRVAGTTTTQSTITNITCSDSLEKDSENKPIVTGICRTAQIWEPNDKKHVQDAIDWYTTSCRKRTGSDVTLDASYALTGDSTACSTIANGTAYATYAVRRAVSSSDNVDVYDGTVYNTYGNSLVDKTVGEETVKSPLYSYTYFTDTKKLLTSTSRPTFMTLAPNSITKVRVYIYIEGQDIDNYDFASIGKKIAVNFGFTKERFTEDDVDYDGPDLPLLEGNQIGTCTGGTVPTTEEVCTEKFGTWANEACSGNTQRYCIAINGTFTATPILGTCSGGTVPTTEETCTEKFGTWDGTACSGNTREYCNAILGTFRRTNP